MKIGNVSKARLQQCQPALVTMTELSQLIKELIWMQDIVYKSTIGTGGFIATIELGHINELLGLVVGLATLVYMVASAVKVIKELQEK
jgi:hypothetical protein